MAAVSPSPIPNVTVHSTAFYFLQALNEVGIEYLFCNFGTDHAPLIEELARFDANGLQAPKVILCPHENVAMHMAGGYAQMTGRGQAVLVHVDAGTANAALGMHNLFRNRIPVLLIAGSAPFTSFGELEGSRDTYVHFIQQPFDQGSLVRPYVKWEYTLPSGITSKEIVRRAHTIMQSEPAGPVYLMLPREILTQPWDEQSVRSFPGDRYGPLQASGADPEQVEQLAARLLTAKNPILITGYAGRDAAASEAIEKLSAFAGIRVIDFLTFVNIGRSFPHFGGFQSNNLTDVDVGVLVDVDVPWIPVATKDNPSTFWAQIDVDVLKSGSPMWSFPANLRIQGKSSRVLTQLLAALQKSANSDFTAAAAARVQRLTAEQSKRSQQIAELAANKGQEGQINPHYVCAEIGKSIEPDDIVINEAVTRQSIPNMQIARPKPGTMISNAGGGLGASGGTALGVKLALPNRCVVQIVGDGSFYFNNPTAVFALAKQYHLPILTVVLDNSGWAAVKDATLRVYPEGQAKAKGLYQADLPTDMDFSKIVEAAAGYGERLVDPAEVPAAIARCLAEVRNGRSALLHACVTKF
ncbi:MAG TPA: thiamine pyrophosphate-requiring protein [Xanthobacteraceae bacterium]|jgi:acetolactate synthase-1/2/3 large subunit